MKKIIFILGLLVSVCQLGFAQKSSKSAANTIISSIPFKLTSHNNISIEAILNNEDTINLMFHTAAGSMTLIKSSTKNINSIIWNNETDVESWGGESKARYSRTNSLRIGETTWDSLSIWETENSGPTTDGKFGPNLFDGKVIEIDFDNNIINLHNSLPQKSKKFKVATLEHENGFMFIRGMSKIGKESYGNRFLIHSGYGGSVLYDDEFVKVNKLGERLKVIDEKELKDSYGNVLKTKKAILPSFKIGGKKFKSMPVGFFEGTIARQSMSVIGGDILKRFNIIIDSERKHIYLKSNSLNKASYSG